MFTSHCLGMSEIPLSMVLSSFSTGTLHLATLTFFFQAHEIARPLTSLVFATTVCHSLAYKLLILWSLLNCHSFHLQHFHTRSCTLIQILMKPCYFLSWYFSIIVILHLNQWPSLPANCVPDILRHPFCHFVLSYSSLFDSV